MKRNYGYCIIALVGVYVACAVGQEFIKSTKAKKVYVSCQQYLELEGDLTLSSNTFWGAFYSRLAKGNGLTNMPS